MYKITEKIINLITNAMEHLRVELIVWGQNVAEVKILRDVFQGDSI